MVLRVLLAGGHGSRASASPYPTCKSITSEFNSMLFEYESFGSLLAHLFLKPYPSLSFIFFVLA